MTFKQANAFRHACKIFDDTKKIQDGDFAQIIEAGRLSPSSMGAQQWEFELLRDAGLLAQVKAACWGQAQISSASHVLVIYAKIADLRPDSAYMRELAAARGKSQAEREAWLGRYWAMVSTNEGSDDRAIFAWARAQCYLAAQNMMMAAAFLGIDSCPIEGFDRVELERVLGIDVAQKRVALVLPFGYRLNEQPAQKYRRSTEQVLSVR